MSYLRELQAWLRRSDLCGLVIPSTDEFLSEFSPPANRALVRSDGLVIWFVDSERLTPDLVARGHERVRIERPDRIATVLLEASQSGPIGADMNRTPAALLTSLQTNVRDDDTVARCRWCKHDVELQGARRAHITDALRSCGSWLG